MKMISRRDFMKASAVVGAAGVLTACGGSSSSTAASSTAASSVAQKLLIFPYYPPQLSMTTYCRIGFNASKKHYGNHTLGACFVV